MPTQFQMLNNRLRRRLFHHILIGVGSVALTVIFMYFFPKRDFISQASIVTAYRALFLTFGPPRSEQQNAGNREHAGDNY